LHARSVAIVGSRSATPQGVEDAERFARVLSEAGLTIVSGLALGVDGAAHCGALGGSGSTVAVVGTGADRVYPASHHTLAARIAADGVIVSEWPLGTPARASNFPQRNRLIAGLVEAVIVVEAAMRSGSLITARLANDMGRDVFALPGSIHAPLSRGCHRLIKQGARLVDGPEEILEELGIALPASCHDRNESSKGAKVQRRGRRRTKASSQNQLENIHSTPSDTRSSLDADASRLLDALGHAPASLEILATRTDMAESTLQATLLRLELAGHISALPGGRFVRAARHSYAHATFAPNE
jgi:DNA processing protein